MKWLWGIMGLVLLFSGCVSASEADPLWEKYIKAKITFQNDIADLLVKAHPEVKGLIVISRDLQVTMAKISQRKYYYLLKNDPGKISRNQGTAQWVNFDWTEENNKKLLGADPEYVALTKTESSLKQKNQGHPDWPALRQGFEELVKTAEYKKISKTLMDTTSEIDEELKRTR